MDNENNQQQEGGSYEGHEQQQEEQVQQQEGTQQEASGQQSEQQEPVAYTLDLGEHWGGTDGLRGNIQTRAQEAGITAEQGSSFVQSVIADMRAEEMAKMEAGEKQLRSDWGEKYDSNISETQKFVARMAESAGLKAEDMPAINSREGLLLMNAIRQQFSEGGAQGGGNASPALSARDEARAMLHDPSNPYYEALTNINAPVDKRRAAVKRYNQLSGFNVFPEP